MNTIRPIPAHLSSLGLERNPFPQTPDADCYFRTENIERQFVEAKHCILSGKGFLLLTGEVGTGKTTFLRALMDELLAEDCIVALVFNTFLQGKDLLRAINRDFGLDPGADIAEDLDRLNHFLIESHLKGKTCVVVIDDAQNLDASSLELLRLLSNLETQQSKLVQILLAGQPELLDILARTEHRQFASRIVQHTQLIELTATECTHYVDFRISRSGSDGRIRLDKAAQHAVHKHSRGNPRRVHLIMDRCMYGVLSSDDRVIGKKLVNTAAKEVGIAPRMQSLLASRSSRLWILLPLFLLVSILGLTGAGIATTLRLHGDQEAGVSPDTANTSITVPAVAPEKLIEPGHAANNCLTRIGAGKWAEALVDGLNNRIRPDITRALTANGLILAKMPSGFHVPQEGADYCQWVNRNGTWLLWHQVLPPFEISNGARGENVRWLQKQLKGATFYSLKIDGIVGAHTLDALGAFRSQHGLSAMGGVDAWTIFLLEHDLGNSPSQDQT